MIQDAMVSIRQGYDELSLPFLVSLWSLADSFRS